MSINQTISVPDEQIRAIAYSLWLEEGQPDGRAEAHWLKALELASETEAPAKPKRKAAAATKAAPRKRG